jgi:hypothetical protein
MTRNQKGNYYRLKTKHWLEAKGFHVETVEKVQRIQGPRGQILYVKKDLLAADIVATSYEQMIFVNSICNRSDLASHIRQFLKYPYPPFVDRWVVLWIPGRRAKRGERVEPEIFDVNEVKEIEE